VAIMTKHRPRPCARGVKRARRYRLSLSLPPSRESSELLNCLSGSTGFISASVATERTTGGTLLAQSCAHRLSAGMS
jgi:hypothetical protein